MDYKCKLIPINQLNVGPMGFVMPLCDTCRSMDCSNPIEKVEMSIVGVTKIVKIHSRGTNPRFVIECDGYLK